MAFIIFPRIQWMRMEKCTSTEFGIHMFSKCFLCVCLLSSLTTYKTSIVKVITLKIPHSLKSSVHFFSICLGTCSTYEFWHFVGTVFYVMYQFFKIMFKVVSWWWDQRLYIFFCNPQENLCLTASPSPLPTFFLVCTHTCQHFLLFLFPLQNSEMQNEENL